MSNYFDGTNTICFTCDSCGRETQGCSIVNGMKFCAKCYQEIFSNKTAQFVELLDKEMHELQLASKDQQIHELQEQLKNRITPKFDIDDEVWAVVERAYALYIFNKPNYTIVRARIDSISVLSDNKDGYIYEYSLSNLEEGYLGIDEGNLFATRDDAEKKLKKLKESD